jgi:hypothetical protein
MPGHPLHGTDARVIDPDTLQEVPVGEQGEIIIHGPEVFEGYWKRPDATASAFIEFEGKRFFRSGDLGRMDEDGYFFLTDRLKRMINASGFKVWPAEVEALDVPPPSDSRGLHHRRQGQLPGRNGEGGGGAARYPQGHHRAANHRLVPREHGGVQGAAHRAVCARLA